MNRYRSISVIAFLLLILLLPIVCSAQKSLRLTAAPRQFQIFYAKFKAALLRKDKNTVATLTQFPFTWGLDAGDEGTYTRAQFLRNFDRLFYPPSQEFRIKNPTFWTENRRITLSTDDASHFVFERRGNSYKFTSFIVEP